MVLGIFEIEKAIISASLEMISSTFAKLSKGGTVEEVYREIEQQDISLQLAQQQARVAQELAIAVRIETAEEVEVEEFYDNSGEGNIGLKGTTDTLSVGVGGSGRKITKRIYKFKGHNGEKLEAYNQKLSEVLSTKTQTDDE